MSSWALTTPASTSLGKRILALPSGDTVNLRGILVNSGKQILAMQTDPGAAVTGKFNAK